MNSKQRRKDYRLWKFEVMLSGEQRNQNGYDAMFDWCVSTFGNKPFSTKQNWREAHRHFGTCWQFTNQESATLFMLRWA
jgi:hypothetical protein